jgi:hypothetical protein
MRHIYNRICRPPASWLMSVCRSPDRSAREYGSGHGLRWRTPGRRWSTSSTRSDNCGKNSTLRDYGRGRSVFRSSLGTHICPRRREPVQRRGRTCVRDRTARTVGQRASNLKPGSARSAGAIHQLGRGRGDLQSAGEHLDGSTQGGSDSFGNQDTSARGLSVPQRRYPWAIGWDGTVPSER